jgi:predicted O-linked N-acetylglucosamine transferase (SPINDLY family)
VASLPFVKNDIITFGSFNNSAKINQGVIKVWSNILHGVPGSRLILKAKQLEDKLVREKILAMFSEERMPSDRIDLKAMIFDPFEHLSLYNEIDIALDPFPYNGTTTTCEALWMGVPVVTFLGDRHSGRVGASILHAIGRAETLVADSSESYIERAISLAGDKELLISLRENLRQLMQNSPLCDAVSFAKKVEEAYQKMWEKFTGTYGEED